MGKKDSEDQKMNREKKDGNDQEPKYKAASGEEIKHCDESIYDHINQYFSQIEQFINTLEMIDLSKIPGIDKEAHQMFLADLGRIFMKDLEEKFNVLYELVEKEVGDIRIDSAIYGQKDIKGGSLLGVYIKKPD